MQNFERGSIAGAYVPPAILKQQEHQRAKLAKDFKNRTVFLETKIETEVVNKSVAKKLSPIEKSGEMIFDTGAYLPSFVMRRQEFDRVKNEVGLKELKSLITVEPEYIPPIIFEEKPRVYSNKVQNYNFVVSAKTARKIGKSVEVLRGSKPEYEIGQQYLADCGMDAHWVYKCAPWKELPICVENESDGAWVPFIVLYRVDYFECKYVKEHGHGREFSQDHGAAYD